MTSKPKTRQEQVYAALRADILGGRVLPGDKLPFADLCERYSASVGVVREALSRLVEQGLVQSLPQQGFSVTSLSAEDLRFLTDARVAIEILTLRQAIAEGDISWESDVLAAHHRLERTPITEGDPPRLREDWAAAHANFHDTLLAGCRNPRLRAIAAGLRDSAELYRRWSVTLVPDHSRDIPAEHRAIMEATVSRDGDLAARLLTEHIELTTRLLLDASAMGAVHTAQEAKN